MRGVAAAFFLWALSGAANAVAAGDGFAGTIAAMLLPAGAYHQFHDWHSIERVSSVRWALPPPNMLDESLPDGAYFTRSGAAIVDGRPLDVVATGVRTMVMNAYFRNRGKAIGAAAVTDGLRRRGFAVELVRCPLTESPEADRHWWRIGGGVQPAWLRVSTRCEGEPCEAFVLMFEQDLVTMTPAESRVYSDRCPPDPTAMHPPLPPWDEQLAVLIARLVPMPGALAARWEDLDTLPRTRWNPPPVLERVGTPDDARFARVGQADLGGRVLHLHATGTRERIVAIELEDARMQADRGDVLAALRAAGIAVELVRCGRPYLLSRGNWYRLTDPADRRAVLRQKVSCDTGACPRAQETYVLTLGDTLPPARPGEQDAHDGRCAGG